MAEENRFAVATGNFSATSTWSLTSGGAAGASVPDTDQHAIIESGNNVTIDANDEIKSLTVNSGGTLTGNASYTLTINGEGDATYGTNGYAIRMLSGCNFGTNVKLICTTQADTWATLNAGSGTLHSLTVNHASCNLILQQAATLAGDLTITAGELDTHSNNYALTVTGATSVTGTLTCNDSTVSLGAAVTSGYALTVGDGGTFTGGTGTHTIGSFEGSGAGSGGSITLSSGNTTISSRNTSASRFFEVSSNANSFANGSGTLIFTTAAGSNIVLNKSGATLNNVQINHASCVATLLTSAITMDGDLTITAGELDTGSDVALTVTGKLEVTGTLTGNASAITTGNVRLDNNSTITHAGTWTVTGPNDSGWLWYNLDANSSNWNPSAGTVHFSHASNLSGQHIQESKFFNLTLTAGASGHDVAWRDSHSNLLTIANDLTIEEGQLKRNDASDTLTVTEDVSVESGGILGRLEATGANNFGSLTIESGGTYNATSGTTTVTSEVGTKCWDNQTGGNFIHNNGKVSFDSSIGDTTFDNAGADPFYDLEVKTNGDCKYLNAITVENELTMNHSNLSFGSWTDASGAITVLGTTRLVDGLGFSGGIDNLNDDYYGFLIVEGGNFRTPEGANAKRCRGIKQTGGTIT